MHFAVECRSVHGWGISPKEHPDPQQQPGHMPHRLNRQNFIALIFKQILPGPQLVLTIICDPNLHQITVWRDGGVHTIAFEQGAVVESLRSAQAGPDERRNGTRIKVWPEPKFFDTPTIPLAELERLLRSKAVLLPGVRTTLRTAKGEEKTWFYKEGLKGYLDQSLEREPVVLGAGASAFP